MKYLLAIILLSSSITINAEELSDYEDFVVRFNNIKINNLEEMIHQGEEVLKRESISSDSKASDYIKRNLDMIQNQVTALERENDRIINPPSDKQLEQDRKDLIRRINKAIELGKKYNQQDKLPVIK